MHVGALALAIILFGSLDVADAQPSRGVPKVGYLDMNEPEGSRRREGFARGLRDLGYVQGKASWLTNAVTARTTSSARF